jgi:serine/threonine protein kinase
VKVIWPAAAGCERACERAKREALTLAKVSHPNVVTVYAAGEIDDSPYLVMEWIEGPSLHGRLASSRPSPRQAARIVRDLARAVAAVHEFGIIHRDIKPDNVLLAGPAAADWERCVPKLADFGLARPAEATHGLTQEAEGLGTPAYMAPEQTGLAENLGAVGPGVDIHGLGGLAFALLTGTPPYAASNAMASLQRAADGDVAIPAVFRESPRDLQAIIEKCLEQQPQRRYASADALADDLDRFLTGKPVQAQPLSTLARLRRTARRKPVHSIAAVLAIAFVTTALGSAAWHAANGARVASSQAQADVATAIAARSMERLTGELIEKMVLQSSPDDQEHVDYLRAVRDEFAAWPLGAC